MATMLCHPVLGECRPDPVAEVLGTGFSRFSSPCGVDGLYRLVGRRLDILAVQSRCPGNGDFRRFVDEAKRRFHSIVFWEVWNESLAAMLLRYGFVADRERDAEGEFGDVMRWVQTHSGGL